MRSQTGRQQKLRATQNPNPEIAPDSTRYGRSQSFYDLETENHTGLGPSTLTYLFERSENLGPHGLRCLRTHSRFAHSRVKKQPRCLSADVWMNSMCFVRTMRCFPAIKRSEALTHAITWLNPENIY